MIKCLACGRVQATQHDFDTMKGGQGPHLCWGNWDVAECRGAQANQPTLPFTAEELEEMAAWLDDYAYSFTGKVAARRKTAAARLRAWAKEE